VTAIRADCQVRVNLEHPARRHGPYTAHPAFFQQQARHFRFHAQMKMRELARLFGKEIQEIPLRHKGDEFGVGWEMAEVGDQRRKAFHFRAKLGHLLMWPAQEFL
jgi:hypothetical protein